MKRPRKTASIKENSVRQQQLYRRDYASDGTALLNQQKEIVVHVRGITETLLLSPRVRFYIGRFHLSNDLIVDLDLSPYGAERYGVSRVHACLEVSQHDRLYITDLDSTNGTLLAGKRLLPLQRTLVRDGDEIIFGNLLMKISFASPEART